MRTSQLRAGRRLAAVALATATLGLSACASSSEESQIWEVTQTIDVRGEPRHLLEVDDEVWIASAGGSITIAEEISGEILEFLDIGSTVASWIQVEDEVWIAAGEYLHSIKIDTREVTTEVIQVGWTPDMALIDGDLWSASTESHRVTILDPTTHEAEFIQLQVGAGTVTEANGSVWVAHQYDHSPTGKVSVIDITTHEVTDVLDVGNTPIDPLLIGEHLWVPAYDFGSDTSVVSVIDTKSATVIQTISVGMQPRHVVQVGEQAVIINVGDNTLSVIDINSYESKTVDIGDTFEDALLIGTMLWLGGRNNLIAVDTADYSVENVIPLESNQRGTHEVEGRLWVFDLSEDVVKVLAGQ